MDYRLPLIFILFCANSAWADFSDARFQTHPIEPAGHLGPYLIEITGEWPTDCHPGEQKPVIREFTGDTALIEFEIIIEHVTCNDVATPYRILIDMSDVIDGGENNPPGIEVTIRFGGIEHTELVSLLCICSPAPIGPDIKPEPGIYEGEGLEKQGILLARQNDRMGVYPLVYDESGNSQWLFGGGGIVEDVYFVKLKELYGGQCLGCPPPDNPPQKEVVGKLTMLMDSEGLIRVKINDGLFKEYKPLVYGYGELKIGGSPRVTVADLSGRWAFSESDIGSNPNGSIPPIDALPLVFDIVLESVFYMLPPIVLEPPTPPGDATYSVRGIDGEEVARMKCTNFYWEPTQTYDETQKWTCIIPELESEDEIGIENQLFEAQLLSLERMLITYSGEILDGGSRSKGVVVRID